MNSSQKLWEQKKILLAPETMAVPKDSRGIMADPALIKDERLRQTSVDYVIPIQRQGLERQGCQNGAKGKVK